MLDELDVIADLNAEDDDGLGWPTPDDQGKRPHGRFREVTKFAEDRYARDVSRRFVSKRQQTISEPSERLVA